MSKQETYDQIAERKVSEYHKAVAEGSELLQLPLWEDDRRAAPSAILRSALFGVVRPGSRKAVERELLAAWSGVELRYSGFQLDQADLDAWLQALHLAREHQLGKDVRFQARSFLRAIGRPGDGNSHRWLRRSLERMVACAVAIKMPGGQEYVGSLINDFFLDKASGRYVLRINPLIAQMFDDAFVKLSMEQRKALGTSLARWLQGYIQSHKATESKPHRIGLARIQELCGSSTKRLRRFRETLRGSMAELEGQGLVTAWRITEGDALEFVR